MSTQPHIDSTPGESAATTPRRSGLAVVSTGLTILLLLWLVGWPLARVVAGGTFATGSPVDRIAIAPVVAAVLGLIGWHLARKAQPTANLTFCALLAVLLAATMLSDLYQHFTAPRGMDVQQIARLGAQSRHEARTRLREEGAIRPGMDRFGDSVEAIERMVADREGQEAAVARATTRVLRQMQASLARYADTYQRLVEAGGVEPRSLVTRQSIAERVQLLDGLRAANEALTRELVAMPVELRRLLAEEGLPDERVDAALVGFRAGAKLPVLLSIRAGDHALIQKMMDMLELLQGAEGQWRYDATSRMIAFDDESLAAQYAELKGRIEEIESQQAARQRQLVGGTARAR